MSEEHEIVPDRVRGKVSVVCEQILSHRLDWEQAIIFRNTEENLMVISTETAEHYTWGEGCDGWHLVKTEMLSIISERVPPGCKEIRHYHQESEQFFFVLSGIASLEVDGQMNLLMPQQGFHVKAGKPHQLSNDQKHDLIFLVTSVPPSHGDRVQAEVHS